jgi:DNA-binding TFAR19-related protein (PDSD5 family)|tara:strand:- start:139 stop:381 length:243 start_codon:yes stop_codon:yes gene_type:complete
LGQNHKENIFREIRLKALKQHIEAYKVISISEIASEFNESMSQIEMDLVYLIKTGRISFKIDAIKKILHAKVANQKLNTL